MFSFLFLLHSVFTSGCFRPKYLHLPLFPYICSIHKLPFVYLYVYPITLTCRCSILFRTVSLVQNIYIFKYLFISIIIYYNCIISHTICGSLSACDPCRIPQMACSCRRCSHRHASGPSLWL